MASPAQAIANLANAQLSTGPKTEAGKRRASLNAMKHGLNSQLVVIDGEDPAQFDAFRDELFHDWSPASTTEASLVDQLAATRWRLRRIARLEAEILTVSEDVAEPDYRRLNILSLHSSRLTRESSTVLKDLRTLQDDRRQQEEKELEAAIAIRKADVTAGRPTDLATFGFVLKVEKVDCLIRREAALAEAATLHNAGRNRKAA